MMKNLSPSTNKDNLSQMRSQEKKNPTRKNKTQSKREEEEEEVQTTIGVTRRTKDILTSLLLMLAGSG